MVAKMIEQGHDVLYYENIEGGHAGAADNKQAAFMQALAYAVSLERIEEMTRKHAVSRAGGLEKTDAYRDDLAYIHDAGFGDFARAAAPVLAEMLRQNGIASGLVIDLGCGSGILSHAISQAGYDVLGIDISDAMVAMARGRVPRGQFEVGSLLTAEFPRSVAVAAVGECINYLFDASNQQFEHRQVISPRLRVARVGRRVSFLDVAEPGRVRGNGIARELFRGRRLGCARGQ